MENDNHNTGDKKCNIIYYYPDIQQQIYYLGTETRLRDVSSVALGLVLFIFFAVVSGCVGGYAYYTKNNSYEIMIVAGGMLLFSLSSLVISIVQSQNRWNKKIKMENADKHREAIKYVILKNFQKQDCLKKIDIAQLRKEKKDMLQKKNEDICKEINIKAFTHELKYIREKATREIKILEDKSNKSMVLILLATCATSGLSFIKDLSLFIIYLLDKNCIKYREYFFQALAGLIALIALGVFIFVAQNIVSTLNTFSYQAKIRNLEYAVEAVEMLDE